MGVVVVSGIRGVVTVTYSGGRDEDQKDDTDSHNRRRKAVAVDDHCNE